MIKRFMFVCMILLSGFASTEAEIIGSAKWTEKGNSAVVVINARTIAILNAVGERVANVLLESDIVNYAISPKDDLIIYSTTDAGTWVVDMQGNQKKILTDKNVVGWAWSPDGSKLLITTVDSNTEQEEAVISMIDMQRGDKKIIDSTVNKIAGPQGISKH